MDGDGVNVDAVITIRNAPWSVVKRSPRALDSLRTAETGEPVEADRVSSQDRVALG